MSFFFVSEPGRPTSTRLPEAIRQRQIDAIRGSDASHQTHERLNESHNQAVDAINAESEKAAKRRALQEYGEHAQGDAGDSTYLPVGRLARQTILSVPATALLGEGLQTMQKHGIHHLVVLAESEVAGLVDQGFVMAWLREHGADEKITRFSDMELPAFLTSTAETDAHQLARLMLAHGHTSALVLDADNRASGLVTSTDFLRHYAERSIQEGDV